MLINYHWLQDFIQEDLPSPEEIADALTMHSFEVEGVEKVGTMYPGVVVGFVESVGKHPDADRLQVCMVDTGDGELRQIVCGASNVAEGQYVPVATPGAVLSNGLEIKIAELRGIESRGMICSEKELGEADEAEGIWVLEKEHKPGTPFDEAMNIETAVVFDVDVLPNRAHDCLSHRGVAAEVAAIFNLTFRDVEDEREVSENQKYLDVKIEDNSLCRRYIGSVINGLEARESPDWLKARLRSLGARPINAIVDVTNYVMFSLGQPLHAFDAATLEKRDGAYAIHVRPASEDESLIMLGGEEASLPEGAAVIADGAKDDAPAIAIAGVKGGEGTNVTDQTTDIILEAATFDPVLTRLTSQTLKIATESSKRFENDLSAELAEKATAMAIELLKEIAGTDATEVKEVVDVYPAPEKPTQVAVTTNWVNQLLGTDIDDDEVESIFHRLRFSFEKSDDAYTVTPPLSRRDLAVPADIAEEIGRIYGYGRVESSPLPTVEIDPAPEKWTYWTERIRDILVTLGWSEVMTYTFRERGDCEIENPLAQDKKFFRANLKDALAEKKQENVRFLDLLGLPAVTIFEIGVVYENGKEEARLGLAVETTKQSPVKAPELLQSVLEKLSDELGVQIEEYGKIENDVFECSLEPIIEACSDAEGYDKLANLEGKIRYKPVSVYPFILRDVAVWVPSNISADDVVAVMKEYTGELLVNLYLFDVYKKDEATSYAFRLAFQSDERTLSDEEVNEIMDQVYGALNEKDGWETR